MRLTHYIKSLPSDSKNKELLSFTAKLEELANSERNEDTNIITLLTEQNIKITEKYNLMDMYMTYIHVYDVQTNTAGHAVQNR